MQEDLKKVSPDNSVNIAYKGKYYTCNEGVELHGPNNIIHVPEGIIIVTWGLGMILSGLVIGYFIYLAQNNTKSER